MEKVLECPYFGMCGGCAMLDMEYEAQLEKKNSEVHEILKGAVREPLKEDWYEGIKPAPMPRRYRNKMEYTFGDEYKDGPLALGMHKKRSFHDIITVDTCVLVHPDFNLILRATRDFFSERKISYFHRKSHEGYLRHLLVRRGVNSAEILVDLVTTTQMETGAERELLEAWKDCLLSLKEEGKLEGSFAGILHTKNDGLADTVRDEGTEVLYGRDHFFESLIGLEFKISPFSFFQTNSAGAELLYETTREYASQVVDITEKKPVIFDLYSGTGTIAQMMSPVADTVVGVEIVEEAVEAAKENAERNGLHNCTFYAGDVMKVVPTLSETPDLIILDPPRDGCHPKALPGIIDFDAPSIVYVSCKVTSLARDLQLLQDRGYRVVRAVAVDEFPLTKHVETIALIERIKNAKDFVQIGIDAEEYYKIKDEDN